MLISCCTFFETCLFHWKKCKFCFACTFDKKNILLRFHFTTDKNIEVSQNIALQSRHQGCSVNFIRFAGKYPCLNIFLNKVAGFRPTTLLKGDSETRVFL